MRRNWTNCWTILMGGGGIKGGQVIGASEYATKLLAAFAAGAGPDVFNQTVSLVAQYYNAHILAPVDYAAMGYADDALYDRRDAHLKAG